MDGMKPYYLIYILMLAIGGCVTPGDNAKPDQNQQVPLRIDIGGDVQYKLTGLERHALQLYYDAASMDEALKEIPPLVQLQLTYKPDLWGLHLTYGYLLDYILKRQPSHPALMAGRRFYSDLVESYPANDVVLYWAARAIDRTGLEVDGFAAKYYRRAIEGNARNRWYLLDYLRGPAVRPPGTSEPFIRARPGKYRPLLPHYERLIRMTRDKEKKNELREELKALIACLGRECDFLLPKAPAARN